MKKIVLFVAFSLTLSFSYAQASPEKSTHYKAAEELMMAMNMPQNVDAAIPLMVEQQVQGNPMLSGKRDAFLAFMQKHMSWVSMRNDYLKIYTEEFTEAELKELAAFYKTDIGKKLAAKQNALTLKSTQLGQSKVQENMTELMQIMQ